MAAPRNRPQHVVSRSASPVIRQMFATLNERGIRLNQFAKMNGCTTATISYWKSGAREPRILDVESALNRLGKKLVIVDI